MTANPSKINGHDYGTAGNRANEQKFAFAGAVVSHLFDLCGGDPSDVFASLHAMQLMVLHAIHEGNHEAMAAHLEQMMPKLAESIRSTPEAPRWEGKMH